MSSARYDFDLPDTVRSVFNSLSKGGEQAYLVGGSLRDLLSERTPVDWDLATTATPKRIMEIFSRVVPTGIDHGTVTVLVGGDALEVTTLRGDGAYTDGRHPDSVVFIKDIEGDLARRDFTINAMAWEPEKRILHDPFRGRDDLAAKLLRAVGDPAARFSEDGLRVMRAARFAATLDFDIEKRTLEAIPVAAPKLVKISIERRRDELLKTMMARAPSRGLLVMKKFGMFDHLIDEIHNMEDGQDEPVPGTWKRTVRRVDFSPAQIALRLAALLFDATLRPPKPFESLRLDKKTHKKASRLLNVGKIDYRSEWDDALIRRFLNDTGVDIAIDNIALWKADLRAANENFHIADELLDRVKRAMTSGDPIVAKDLRVDGDDLMKNLELEPGPHLGNLLERLLSHVIDHPKDNEKSKLIDVARRMLSS